MKRETQKGNQLGVFGRQKESDSGRTRGQREWLQENTLYTTKAFQNGVAARSILETCLSDQAAADRALVKQGLEAGKSLEEATAEFTTDQYFEQWYQQVLTQLNQLEI